MRCHFNDADLPKPKQEYITHPEIDCVSCHMQHGSNNNYLLIDAGIDLCNSCHADAHSGSHPVGEGIIDKRTNKEVVCLSCHQMHGADFDKYLPLNPEADLCVQCHRK